MSLRVLSVAPFTFVICHPIATGIHAAHLLPCKAIIEQHCQIWFRKKPGATAKKLRHASALINGLLLIHDPNQTAVHLHAAMREKTWADVIRCVCSFRGAGKTEKELVKEHRHMLQNNLLAFLESLENLYHTQLLNSAELANIKWPAFMKTALQAIEDVPVEDDIEGEVAAL